MTLASELENMRHRAEARKSAFWREIFGIQFSSWAVEQRFINTIEAMAIYWQRQPKPKRSTISMAIAACYP